MRVAFLTVKPLRHESLESGPLGGSESSLLIVARGLAQLGVTVYVVTGGAQRGVDGAGVEWLSLPAVRRRGFPPLDALVSLNRVIDQKSIPRAARYLHWHQNDVRSPYGRHFSDPAFARHVARLVFVSRAQADAFVAHAGLEAQRMRVVGNPIAAPFCEPDAAAPARDLERLVYASAPNRGLELLMKLVWPRLRAARPSLTLEIFSGFTIRPGRTGYVSRDGKERTQFYQGLLAACERAPGVTLQRGVRKAELASALRASAMLCYPCVYRETCCIVALEAMAAGCQISTTDCGALEETTAGFASITRLSGREPRQVAEAFSASTLAALEQMRSDPVALEAKRVRQVEYVRQHHGPGAVTAQWRSLLEGAP